MLKNACKLFCAALCCATTGMALASASDSLTIRFTDLGEYAQTKSLGASAISGSLGLVKAERDIDLQRSNPELAFDRQSVDNSRESQITLGKNFEMPWVTMKKRSAWNDRLSSAEYAAEEQKSLLLGDLKSGYVSLQLLNAQLTRLTHLSEVITDASHVATTRHTEGHLSGVEDHLIQMVVISLQAEQQSVLERQRAMNYLWRALMGFDSENEIVLSTPISFRPVSLEPAQMYVMGFEKRPAYQSRLLLQQSLGKHASAERSRLLPSFNLYGGYKKIGPDYEGYVIGISLSLPLLNTNRATARKFDLERQLVANERTRYRSEQIGRIEALVASIQESKEALALSQDHFDQDTEALNDLLYSYEEGWLTLNEMLNAVQIEVAGLSDYFDHLIRYYQNVFELEAITGATLVSFE
jgi:Outer membrane efflux protein